MWEIMARDAFVESLGDPALRLRILERDPTTLEEALKMASRLEALGYGEQDNDWDDVGRRRGKYIKTTVAGEQSDQKCQQARTVKDLKEKLAKKDDQERQLTSVIKDLKKEMAENRRELERLRKDPVS